jgi:hypothetical protein
MPSEARLGLNRARVFQEEHKKDMNGNKAHDYLVK